jgi:hypothetical protein
VHPFASLRAYVARPELRSTRLRGSTTPFPRMPISREPPYPPTHTNGELANELGQGNTTPIPPLREYRSGVVGRGYLPPTPTRGGRRGRAGRVHDSLQTTPHTQPPPPARARASGRLDTDSCPPVAHRA